jgi:peptidoglycan biosynthesis protein MviN/MurJ (putative lipid II flippase)
LSDNFSLSKQIVWRWRSIIPAARPQALGRSVERLAPGIALTASLSGLAAANILFSSLMYGYVLIALGPGPQTDALFASVAVPRLVLAVIGGSLANVLIPVLALQAAEDVGKSGWSLFLLAGCFFGALEMILHLLAPLWVPAVVPGFSEDMTLLTVELARVQLVAMVLSALCSVLGAYYQATRRMIRVELISLLAACLSFAVLIWALPNYGIKAAAWTVVLRTGLQVSLLLPGLGRFCQPDWRSPVLTEVWVRLKPLLFGSTYYKLGPLVDRFLSSMTPAGGLSLLYIGQQILTVASDIIYRAFTLPLLPILTRHAQAGEWRDFRRLLSGRLIWVGLLTGGGYLVFFLYGESMLSLLVRYGRISGADLHSLWVILIALAGFLIAGAMGQINSAAFYARADTATPTTVGVVGFTIGIGLKVAGFFQFGLVGIAVGTTLYYVLNMVVLLILQKRELGRVISR